MSIENDEFLIDWWENNLEAIDREIARMATLCRVDILDRDVVTRVIKNDASVCGTSNPKMFEKLRHMVMLHFAVRQKSADTIGQARTAQIEDYIVERLSKSFPDLGSEWKGG